MLRSLQRLALRWAGHYGMAGVLILLCAFFAWATWGEQNPQGLAAAADVVDQLSGTAQTGRVLVVAQTTPEDARFTAETASRLKSGGYTVVEIVQGDPRAARQALQRCADAGQSLQAVATTPECAAWTVFEGLSQRLPALGNPQIVAPRAFQGSRFLTRANLLNVANQIAVVAILAAGMTVVILTGGIDLSVGSLIALSAVATSLVIQHLGGAAATTATLLVAGMVGILTCAACGGFSGAMVTLFRIPPFIATLAVMQVASGLAYILARGNSIYDLPETFTWLGRGATLLGVPNAVVLMLGLYAAMHVLMSHTVIGRHIYATGSNPETARLCGVRVPRVLLFAYALCGALAGLGGVILASQLKSGAPTYGLSYELYVIAAAVVGGTSLNGGEGRILGTLIGAFIIAVIQNGMNLTGVESYTQKVVLGLVILAAVLLDTIKRGGLPPWMSLRRGP